jgi:hypothetical protein
VHYDGITFGNLPQDMPRPSLRIDEIFADDFKPVDCRPFLKYVTEMNGSESKSQTKVGITKTSFDHERLFTAGIRSVSECLSGFRRSFFELRARLLPGISFGRNGATSFSFAIVVTGLTLTFAIVLAVATVGLRSSTIAHACAGVVSACAIPFTGIQSATGMYFFFLICRKKLAGSQQSSYNQTAKSS